MNAHVLEAEIGGGPTVSDWVVVDQSMIDRFLR